MSRHRRVLFGGLAAAALILLVYPAVVGLAVDSLWFRALGYETVFLTRIAMQVGLFVGVGVLAVAFFYLNLRHAQRGMVPHPLVLQLNSGTVPLNVTRGVRRLAAPISLVVAGLIGLGSTGLWLTVLRWVHRVPFGTTDPVWGRDIGFYVFSLPLLRAALGIAFTLLVLALLIVAPVYWLRRDIIVAERDVRVEPSAALHLALLLGGILLLNAVRIWTVGLPDLLFSTTGPLVGASYTDLHARLPGLHLSAVVSLLAAGAVILGALRRELFRYTAWAVGVYVGVALLARGAFPAVIQNFVVAPTELTREAPYLRRHIAATRRAWGLDSVETRDLSGEATLSLADIRANASTIDNVRLWDRDPLLQTFGQLQEIRTYYDFVSVDDDRYRIGGRLRQVLLSPRELNPASLPTRTFINEHLTFTHGMGLTLAPVNQVTEEGLPVLLIRDLPPASDVSLSISRPQIYYGELSDSYVLTDTRQREFDYPQGEENIFTRYDGRGGVSIGPWWRRLLFASYFGSSKILFTADLTPETRVLFHRNIAERARTALPFLHWDEDPYLVITDAGRLVWILDAYTVSGSYPYAARLGDGTSYMRNSVKVTIDAYDGTVRAYLADPGDPIAASYARAFPGVFAPLRAMPADLRAHIRYPEDLYRAQTALYTVYHMAEPDEFYHREDQWQIPSGGEGSDQVPFMRHIVMRLPEEQEAEYIFMTPFTPRGKENLAAWIVARNDGENYGKLRVYRFPKQSLIFGPSQIVNRINQDTEISRQISLWDQRGSEVIRGELLVIPIEESLIYVQPLYLRAQGGRIPELKRVVVAYQNQVVMGETLDEALAVLFGAAAGAEPPAAVGAGAPAPTAPPPANAGTARQAQAAYERALAAQRAGNWAEYGAEIERLGALLRQLAPAGSSPNP